MSIVTASILVIGDEILSGRTKDKNIGYIAEYLTNIGIDLKEVRVVPDEEAEIVTALNALRTRYTYVFTTGGIGPTHDDITADCVAKAFGVTIDVDPRARKLMEERFAARGVEMNEARHALARLGVFDVARGIALAQHGISLGVVLARHAKGLGDRIRGDVVMRRADAAGGEDIGVAGAHGIHRRYDLVFLVGNDAHLLQVDPDGRHDVGEMADIFILGAAGQNLVADDKHGGSDDFRHGRLRRKVPQGRPWADKIA